MPGPLDGIKVVDLSAIISGPLAAMMLADQGADVIKVEAPGIGDLIRVAGFARGGLSSFYLNANRGKRCVVIDITKPRGRELVLEVARDADVFVQNYRPGVVERLGLGYDALRTANEQIIYCSVSGYGPSGPYRDRPVYDPIIQGLSGHVAVQKNPDVPIRDLVRNIVADKSSAYTAAQAITAALFARERGAGGQHIDVPMLDASLAFFWSDGMMAHTLIGDDAAKLGPMLYEVYRLTETADGHLIYFVASEAQFQGLFRALDRPDLSEDERFVGPARLIHAEELGVLLVREFQKFSTKDIMARLIDNDVPAGPVLDLEEIFADPQVCHNAAVYEADHPSAGRIRQPRPAARFSATPQEPGAIAPLHGEHSDAVFGELGYSAEQLAGLRADGVIA